jgi:hypothetical protein
VIIGADRMYKLCDFGSAIKGPVFPYTERERSLIAEDIDRYTSIIHLNDMIFLSYNLKISFLSIIFLDERHLHIALQK